MEADWHTRDFQCSRAIPSAAERVVGWSVEGVETLKTGTCGEPNPMATFNGARPRSPELVKELETGTGNTPNRGCR